jgi:hypothetical protein
MERQEIIKICEKYKIKNYTINDDGSIDVAGDVDLSYIELNDKSRTIDYITELPLRFNKVTGDFDCGNNNLITLKGSPLWVGGSFICSYNNLLTTLEFSPEYVGGGFYCDANGLTTLKGAPKWVGYDFNCSCNELTSLEFSPDYIGDDFLCDLNPLLTDNYCETEIGGSFYTGLEQDGLIINYSYSDDLTYNNHAINYKEWRVLQKRKRTLEKLFQKDLVD